MPGKFLVVYDALSSLDWFQVLNLARLEDIELRNESVVILELNRSNEDICEFLKNNPKSEWELTKKTGHAVACFDIYINNKQLYVSENSRIPVKLFTTLTSSEKRRGIYNSFLITQELLVFNKEKGEWETIIKHRYLNTVEAAINAVNDLFVEKRRLIWSGEKSKSFDNELRKWKIEDKMETMKQTAEAMIWEPNLSHAKDQMLGNLKFSIADDNIKLWETITRRSKSSPQKLEIINNGNEKRKITSQFTGIIKQIPRK